VTQTKPQSIQAGNSLTDQVLQFQKSGSGLDSLLQQIAPMVYRFPRRERSADEDDCGDFYCFFIPRVPGLLRRFEYRGRAFEVYLIACMRWQFRSYANRRIRRDRSATVARSREFWPSPVTEPDTVSESPAPVEWARELLKVDQDGRIGDPVMARRVILIALKASQEVDAPTIQRVARLTGVTEEWLRERIDLLHSRLRERRERRALLRKRRDQAFFRLRDFESRLRNESRISVRTRLATLIEQESAHVANSRRALSRVPVSPTHRDIAEVLGIPKGSVDSGLYYMRSSSQKFDLEISEAISPN